MSQPLFSSTAGEVARVALPVPVDALFDYAVPEALTRRALPGCRVQVRFRERRLTGVLVERRTHSGFRGKLRPIEKVVDPEPVLSQAMLAILREAARETLCPLGIALATALPPGSAPRLTRGYEITPRGRDALRAGAVRGAARRLLDALAETPRSEPALRRRRGRGKGGLARLLAHLQRDGLVSAREVERAPAARPATVRTVELTNGVDVEASAAEPLRRAPRQAALLRKLAGAGPVPLRSLCGEFPRAAPLVRALSARGLVVVREREAPRDVLGAPLEPPRTLALTPEQSEALEPIADAVAAQRFETFLLHGVTGSGKTEVYLRAVAEALAIGRQALVLVPEITLTHQILARLRGRFGDNLAVLHSGLRPGERLEQWQRLRRGSTPIAVGARSALFAPLEDLGAIVIDEEHDDAYKNDEGFRYHARDLAARRAAHARCPLVLGSATPSVETRFAADRGLIRRLSLPRRIGRRPLPAVTLVNLARERELTPRGRKVILSPALRRAMAETLAGGGQTILFLNRRGFSTQILCFDCGFAERCCNCDIALVYHATQGRLLCHYCDFSSAPPERCARCGAPETALLGLGTERVEEEVRTHFPEARIARLDRDTAQQRGFVEAVLRDLRTGRVDVLVGTQMVAKGHDFPGVRLVGVVLADVGLQLPDFRAAERTFQLLTQVAGRAGRDTVPGRVIVQTFAPMHYAVRPARDHDYESFYAEELGYRAPLGYPPFGRLAHAVISGPDEHQTLDAARSLARDAARSASGSRTQVLGPAPAPLAKLRGRHRFQLLIKGPDEADVRRAAAAALAAAARLAEPLQAHVDCHPVNML